MRSSNRKGYRLANSRRSASGQAIVEGVVSTYVLVMVGVCLILLMLGIGRFVINQEKLNSVATQVARQYMSQKNWLGMKLPESETTNAEALGNATCKLLEKELGLPQIAPIYKQGSTTVTTTNGAPLTVDTVTVTLPAPNLFVQFGSLFSLSSVYPTGIGVATADVPFVHGLAYIETGQSGNPSNIGHSIMVPCYSAFTNLAPGSGTSNYIIPEGTIPGSPPYACLGVRTPTSVLPLGQTIDHYGKGNGAPDTLWFWTP